MSEKNIKIITGKIGKDIHGGWPDCDLGLYIDTTRVDSILFPYIGENVTIIIGGNTAITIAGAVDEEEEKEKS